MSSITNTSALSREIWVGAGLGSAVGGTAAILIIMPIVLLTHQEFGIICGALLGPIAAGALLGSLVALLVHKVRHYLKEREIQLNHEREKENARIKTEERNREL